MSLRPNPLLSAAGFLSLLLAACAAASPTPDGAPTEKALEAAAAASPEATTRSFAGSVPAPEFPTGLDWLNTERPLSLEQLRGKIVLLDFWTYGCINCIHIIPDLKRLEAEYADELVVIGVHSAKFSTEGQTENIRQIILRYELEHPVVNDRDFAIWQLWGANAWPTLVLIDPAGNIVGGHSGESVYPLFQPVIEALVQEFDARGELDRTQLDLKLEREGLPQTVLSFPGKVLADPVRNRLFIADSNHHRIVVAALPDGEVLAMIGSGERGLRDGSFERAAFAQPQGLALSPDGRTLYVADTENHALRQVDLESQTVTTLAGTGEQARAYPPQPGTAPDVALSSPWDLALDGRTLYIAMAGSHQIWRMDLDTREIEAHAGSGRESTQNGPLSLAELAQPSGLALDGQGRLFFADSESSSIRWADLDPAAGFVRVLAGSDANLFDFGDRDGVGTAARLQHPLGVAYLDGVLYVADTYNSKIKVVDPETGEVVTLYGSGHGWRDGTDPLFYEPGGLHAADGRLYVADTNNHAVRIIDLASGEAHTLVLQGIERFTASAEAAYGGKVVRYEPVQLARGQGTVRLRIELPPGYKVNDLAPSSMDWEIDGAALELPADADWSVAGPAFPIDLPVTLQPGESTLIGELTLVYCEAEKQSLCLIERVRFEVPFVVGDSGESQLELVHRVELPAELDS